MTQIPVISNQTCDHRDYGVRLIQINSKPHPLNSRQVSMTDFPAIPSMSIDMGLWFSVPVTLTAKLHSGFVNEKFTHLNSRICLPDIQLLISGRRTILSAF